jgi:hypothetical protein
VGNGKMNIGEIIGGLTLHSKYALCGMNGEWQELDQIGPFIYGGAMKALLNRGLVEKCHTKTHGKVAYHATRLGLAVRKALMEMNDG